LQEKLATTNERCLARQAELLASTVDTGQPAALAQPTVVGQRRIHGLKLHDDRVIRVLETLLHPAAFAADWTTRDLHTRILARHHLAESDYRLSQLRYDLGKLRAKGLVERVRKSRRYRLTPLGLKLGCCSSSCTCDCSDLSLPSSRPPARVVHHSTTTRSTPPFKTLIWPPRPPLDCTRIQTSSVNEIFTPAPTNGQRPQMATLLLGRRPEAVAPDGADQFTLALWPTS